MKYLTIPSKGQLFMVTSHETFGRLQAGQGSLPKHEHTEVDS